MQLSFIIVLSHFLKTVLFTIATGVQPTCTCIYVHLSVTGIDNMAHLSHQYIPIWACPQKFDLFLTCSHHKIDWSQIRSLLVIKGSENHD